MKNIDIDKIVSKVLKENLEEKAEIITRKIFSKDGAFGDGRDRIDFADPKGEITKADFLLIESTYGNRLHRSMDETLLELEHAIKDTLKRKHGNVIVPAFAVGRSQEILVLLADLRHRQRLPAQKTGFSFGQPIIAHPSSVAQIYSMQCPTVSRASI